MLFSFAISLVYGIGCIIFYKKLSGKARFQAQNLNIIFYFAIVVAIFVRGYFAFGDYFFEYDVNCFKIWSDYTVTYGLNNLYGNDFFLDYPPGYMYVLYFLRNFAQLFKISIDSAAYIFLLKLPAMIADFACAALIYKVSEKSLNANFAKFFSAAFLLMPVVILNSSVWGQIDSVFTFFLALALWFAYTNKTVFAAISFAIALLIKPQALLFGPIFLFYIINKKSFKEFLKAVVTGGLSIIIISLPFCKNIFDFSWLVELYIDTFAGYKYFTVNAYNIFYSLGLNWKELAFVKNSELINIYAISLLIIIVGFIFLRGKNPYRIFTCAAFSTFFIFLFTTMMHERYVFPSIVFLFLLLAITKSKKILYITLLLGTANYLNTVFVLDSYFSEFYAPKFVVDLIVFFTLVAFILFVIYIYKSLKRDGAFCFSVKQKEILAVAGVTGLYAAVAIFALGSSKAPETYFQSGSDNMSFDIVFDEMVPINNIKLFSGIGDEFEGEQEKKVSGDFEIYYSADGMNFEYLCEFNDINVFTWVEQGCDINADAVRILAKNTGDVLNEIIFFDNNGNVLEGQIANYNKNAKYNGYNALDESHYLPQDRSYYYSAYFDEIYHARTAYEQLNGYSIYETTHPPLGKIMISIGIFLFGMNPFGWRIVGVLCGVLMIPIIYLLAKAIFKNFFASLTAAILLAVDFMHITQTRLATVDTFVVLFTMLTFLFMIYYHNTDFFDTKKQRMYLLLSGFFMGCCVAVKWNGAYAMIGLAVFFFISILSKYFKSKKIPGAKRQLADTILFCYIAFLAVPLIVYALSFIPAINPTPNNGFFKQLINYQTHMFDYHSTLVAEHPFDSAWYTWPFNITPIWYTVADTAGGLVSTISAFGNPLIWIFTPFAAIICGYFAIKDKNISIAIIPLGYIFAYLPWVFVTRLSFIYHYFPVSIFGILAIAWVVDYCINKNPKCKNLFVIYMLAAAIAFAIFFPVITGISAPKAYIDALEIMPSWYFVA